MAKRYFEFSEGSSNKFWEVWVDGNKVLTRYGKIGAGGQTTVKDEGSPDAAQKLHDKLVREKTGKGYEEKGGGGAAAPAPVAAVAPVKKIAVKKEAAPAAAPAAPAPVTVEAGFRRFEFVEGGSSKFWEVKVEDSEQTVRFGKIGTAGQEKVKEFDGPGEAKADTKKLIGEKTGKGYVEVGGKPKPEGNPQLEAAIEAKLDDAQPYLVYADWLQGKGDPLGELIVMQQQNSPAAKALLKKHKETFLGPLANFGDEKYGKGVKLEWQFGFIKHAEIRWDSFSEGDDDPTGDLVAVLELPTARFLQSLRLGPCAAEDEMSFQALIDAFEETKKPATLRELYLGNVGDWDISSTYTGNFGSIAPLFPKLEKLTLHAGGIDLGKNVSLPELTSLAIETGGLSKDDIKEILSLKAPKLERLEIWFGNKHYGASGGVKDIMPIIDGSAFPKLKHLGIMNCEWVGEASRALVGSKMLKQLESLDLSMGCLSDADIDAMVARKESFAHLKLLNVEDSALTNASKPKVKLLAKEANFGKEQSPDRIAEEGYRYVSVGE
jgi:uncharacterized protein (TIGR02996 family)